MSALLWTFPVLMLASIVVGWAAELTAVWLSTGIALAVLAWLQTSPEFAVEAAIAWSQNTHLALANLTGSLRLLLGLGWPMIFFIHWLTKKGAKPRDVVLPMTFCVEAAGLLLPILYFLFIYAKGTWTVYDGIILCSLYGVYFWLLNRERKLGMGHEAPDSHDDDEPWVVRRILKFSKRGQLIAMFTMFGIGGAALIVTVHPFVEGLKAAALSLGVSEFVFIQWIAPIASEFPEKVTAFNWARKAKKVPLALVNMLASVTSQWTLLAGIVPILFCISAGRLITIEFDAFQRTELLLTIAQSAVAVIIFADLKIRDFEAVGLFALWLAQLVMPSAREELIPVYIIWFLLEALRLAIGPDEILAWKGLRRILFPARR